MPAIVEKSVEIDRAIAQLHLNHYLANQQQASQNALSGLTGIGTIDQAYVGFSPGKNIEYKK